MDMKKILDQWFNENYIALRQRAARQLKSWWGREPVEVDELVHLLYQKLLKNGLVEVDGIEGFLNLSEQHMKRILIDCHRHNNREGRGGGRTFLPIDDRFKY